MQFLNLILDIIHRIKHPNSLPSDVSTDLGLEAYGRLTVQQLVQLLKDQPIQTSHLKKFMQKGAADALFKHAVKKDIFKFTSRFSYFFNQGLLEIVLNFDHEGRLRRAYAEFHSSKENLTTEIQMETLPLYRLTENVFQR